MGHRSDNGWIDRVIRWLADQQHGTVAIWQLVGVGITRHAIRHRIERHRLVPLHRGVYAVGHRALTADGRRMAAALAGGRRAALSNCAAAAARELPGFARDRIEVTVPTRREPQRGIEWHRASLPDDEIEHVRGIPVTGLSRTIFDLAATRPRRYAERALHEAEVLRLTDPLSLGDLLARYPRRRGRTVVRAILADRAIGLGVPKGVFAEAFIDFLDAEGFPRPELNVYLTLDGYLHEIDCLFRTERVAVELDGRAVHDTTGSFETDRVKDRRLLVAGWRPVRVTWRQLSHDPRGLAADLGALLLPALAA